MSTTYAEKLAASHSGGLRNARYFGHDRIVSRAISLLRHREGMYFDPVDATALTFDDDGVTARGGGGREIYPRVDPAVIGLIELRGQERILLGRNAHRSAYFSLIAGYVELGENLEEAFTREALEETGRRVQNITYWGSQPWAMSGSLMAGFTAVTDDREPVTTTDGELAETRWASRADLDDLALAQPGSIAHTMITEWRNAQ
ncbi:NAD(+) diphosphatase [Corynebacterium alimapuense]|uniref:NAD(+) diphosphatase n=1 Tax=Corynebacterium alimapuense TaxID=1576874 RepID=UPI001FE2AF28|nr:NAD(+) diphosphatase [Corynebacterium alimapuense]